MTTRSRNPSTEPAEKEFSVLNTSTIADRIRRANDQIVPASPHTAFSIKLEQSCQDVMADLEGSGGNGEQAPSPAVSGLMDAGRPARMGSLRRSPSKRQSGAGPSGGGGPNPRDMLRRLSKINPASHIQTEQMSKFLSGFRRFHKRFFADNTSLFADLQQGQAPKTLLIGCCDSRCDPAIITDCDPGDLFIIRNVANLVPPYIENDTGVHGTSAAMEFAVKGLKVQSIIVMGHTQCGGIASLLQGEHEHSELEFLGSWMRIAQAARDITMRDFADKEPQVQARACEHASILCSLQNLTTYPWIRDRLAAGEISINGWYFDFTSGDLLAYHPETDSFKTLMPPDANADGTESPPDDSFIGNEDEHQHVPTVPDMAGGGKVEMPVRAQAVPQGGRTVTPAQ
ncbi:hypothetical protein HKX48_005643 [Thoreauomyces humboldtii]|nr:hypothetical protein HKX48_005643 [Thoreauomyces humboldtii]